jgi:ubiquinone/menaquinone biosynthesis C-methylase UbiE
VSPARSTSPDDTPGWHAIDAAFASYLDAREDVPHRWLLIQTLATSVMRRQLLGVLGVQPGWRTLDIGTGFGPLPMELAALVAVDAVGIDLDISLLQAAESVRADVAAHGGFLPASRVSFVPGDAYAVEEPDASFDLATARFVFQHLSDHARAVAEVARLVRPGGLACIIDVDDGLSLTHPEPSEAYRLLTDALTTMQGRSDAGRRVARTLPARLDGAGFDIRAVLAIPQAEYRSSRPGEPQRRLLIERFVAARQDLVTGGFLSADQFDDALSRFTVEVTGPQCTVEAHLAVVGQRR